MSDDEQTPFGFSVSGPEGRQVTFRFDVQGFGLFLYRVLVMSVHECDADDLVGEAVHTEAMAALGEFVANNPQPAIQFVRDHAADVLGEEELLELAHQCCESVIRTQQHVLAIPTGDIEAYRTWMTGLFGVVKNRVERTEEVPDATKVRLLDLAHHVFDHVDDYDTARIDSILHDPTTGYGLGLLEADDFVFIEELAADLDRAAEEPDSDQHGQ